MLRKKERTPAPPLYCLYTFPSPSASGSRFHARAAAVAVATKRCGAW